MGPVARVGGPARSAGLDAGRNNRVRGGVRSAVDGTLQQARARFFADNGFGADGGYNDDWQDVAFGPVPYSVPNPTARSEALRVHDLHHPITGYGADWRGEAEISAWELGSGGGGRYAYAWFIALFGLLTGLIALPRATWHAFVRGCRSHNLYGEEHPTRRLRQPLQRVRRELGVRRERGTATWRDRVRFAGWATLSLAVAAGFAAGIPLLLAAGAVRRLSALVGCPLAAGC